MKKVAGVIISNAIRQYDKIFDYYVPDKLCKSLSVGMRVLVPFGSGNHVREAFVFELKEDDGLRELKFIKKVIENYPLLSPEMIRIAKWMKKRYICTYYAAVKCMLPSGVGLKTSKNIRLKKIPDKLSAAQIKVISVLKKYSGECSYAQMKEDIGTRGLASVLRALEKKGCIEVIESYTVKVKEKTLKAAAAAISSLEINNLIESNKIRSIQQIRVMEILRNEGAVPVQELQMVAGITPSLLKSLEKKGYIKFQEINVERNPLKEKVFEKSFSKTLTEVQKKAFDVISTFIEKKICCDFLLRGVTGSGKTEVYLQLIDKVLDRGRQAIVLVPEISLTSQMVRRFEERFPDNVAVLHSRLSMGERFDQWQKIRKGEIGVVIGARSAIFAPFDNLGIIVIDEEHESSYKSESIPKYHVKQIAFLRCRVHNALLLSGSATPSVESYYKAKIGKTQLVEMPERIKKRPLPPVEIIDMREEIKNGNNGIFSKRLLELLKRNKVNGEQSILFLNRRGYSTFVMCKNCRLVFTCPNCSVSLTYHSYDNRLICHYCGFTNKAVDRCPKCESKDLYMAGSGTQKVESEIKEKLSEFSVIRMDMDSTGRKNAHWDIIEKFAKGDIDILVGTQMVAKGHDFPNVTLVGIIAADSMLNTGGFRSCERSFQLITQAAGRAGRGLKPGRVVVQAYNIDHYSIKAALQHDYISFYRDEIKMRKKMHYPPFTHIGSIIVSGYDLDKVMRYIIKIRDEILNKTKKWVNFHMTNPGKAPVYRIDNRFRLRIIIKYYSISKIVEVLTDVSDKFTKILKKNKLKLSLDIDPVNML